MDRTAVQWLARSLGVITTTAFLGGCAGEGPLDPEAGAALLESAAAQGGDRVGSAATAAASSAAARAVDLGVCDNLRPPAGSKLAFHTYAAGVQIYHWNGTTWIFDGPLAVLSADRAGRSTVGTHYAGPTWESAGGSKVVATVVERCTPDPDAIAWLLLGAVSNDGPGIFRRVTFIQRVNTVGGNAPALPGSFPGEEARVPYTTEYLFYRAQ